MANSTHRSQDDRSRDSKGEQHREFGTMMLHGMRETLMILGWKDDGMTMVIMAHTVGSIMIIAMNIITIINLGKISLNVKDMIICDIVLFS